MQKLIEHTYGPHIYMKINMDTSIEEIDVYIKDTGLVYKTTKDNDLIKRQAIINAFNELY